MLFMSSIIDGQQKVETAQASISTGMDQSNVEHI